MSDEQIDILSQNRSKVGLHGSPVQFFTAELLQLEQLLLGKADDSLFSRQSQVSAVKHPVALCIVHLVRVGTQTGIFVILDLANQFGCQKEVKVLREVLVAHGRGENSVVGGK